MRPLLGLTIAAVERLFKAASASEFIHQPSLKVRTADMLTATVHRASLPGMPQQLHVRYAIFLITDGNSRQTERVKSVWQNSNPFSAGSRARAYQVCSNCAGNLANEATTATSRNEVSLGCDAACWIVFSSSAVLLNHLYSALFHTLEPLMLCSRTLDSALLHRTRTESLIAALWTRYQPVERSPTKAVAPYQESPLGRQNHLAKLSTERVVDMQQVSMWAAT